MIPITQIKGVIPAMLTCFDDDGNFSPERQKKFTEYLIRKGINGLYLTGSTGEAFLMSPDEKKKVGNTIESVSRCCSEEVSSWVFCSED